MVKLISSLFSAIGYFFQWKSSPNKQYSDAESAVEKAEKKREEEVDAIQEAVYEADENHVNSIINCVIAVVLAFSLCACFGTAKVKVVRVTEDRYVSCVTNSLGEVVYWKVPPSVMAELLEDKTELRELKKQNKVKERLNVK